MSQLVPFLNYFIDEAVKNASMHELIDRDINKACFEIQQTPIDITPKAFNQNQQGFLYKQPETLFVYPSRSDSENYLLKSEQLVESMHGIQNQAVFEIRGNKKKIECCFYAEKPDIEIIDSSVRNFYPKSITDKGTAEEITGDFYVYDFLPDAAFYKALTSHNGFIISPLNLIPQLLLNIDENHTGVYQVLFKSLSGCHELVKDACDIEWKALQKTDTQIPPSLQPTSKKIEYKSPDFKSYFSICIRLILPKDLISIVQSFIHSYSYGSKNFKMLNNSHYSQEQIRAMINKRASYHTGFLANSHEVTGLLHTPYQILEDKTFTEIFETAPVGDKPVKTLVYNDISIGTWVCGSNSKEIHLPPQKEIPHAHVLGVSRVGKSILLGHIAIERLKRNQSCFVLDPHGDLITNILRMTPEHLRHKVIVIDFGLKDYTPQITIRQNIDITNPSKASDDLTESMRDVKSGKENFWGPKMSYAFSCLYFIYCVLPDLNLTDIRHLISTTKQSKVYRQKIKARISHPIIKDFLDELDSTRFESIAPVITRLSHLLLDEKSLRLFTLDENKISISDIMENENYPKLCLINLSIGTIGKQRSSILSGLMDSLINNNVLARANIPYHKRKICTVIKDEFYLGPGDLDSQLTGLAKYGLSVIFAHQYINQVDGNTRDVMATAGSRIIFKIRREDADRMGKEFEIDPSEFTDLRKFQAIMKIEDEIIKIDTPVPCFLENDFSEEIMKHSLREYYLKHESSSFVKEEKKLFFDTL